MKLLRSQKSKLPEKSFDQDMLLDAGVLSGILREDLSRSIMDNITRYNDLIVKYHSKRGNFDETIDLLNRDIVLDKREAKLFFADKYMNFFLSEALIDSDEVLFVVDFVVNENIEKSMRWQINELMEMMNLKEPIKLNIKDLESYIWEILNVLTKIYILIKSEYLIFFEKKEVKISKEITGVDFESKDNRQLINGLILGLGENTMIKKVIKAENTFLVMLNDDELINIILNGNTIKIESTFNISDKLLKFEKYFAEVVLKELNYHPEQNQKALLVVNNDVVVKKTAKNLRGLLTSSDNVEPSEVVHNLLPKKLTGDSLIKEINIDIIDQIVKKFADPEIRALFKDALIFIYRKIYTYRLFNKDNLDDGYVIDHEINRFKQLIEGDLILLLNIYLNELAEIVKTNNNNKLEYIISKLNNHIDPDCFGLRKIIYHKAFTNNTLKNDVVFGNHNTRILYCSKPYEDSLKVKTFDAIFERDIDSVGYDSGSSLKLSPNGKFNVYLTGPSSFGNIIRVYINTKQNKSEQLFKEIEIKANSINDIDIHITNKFILLINSGKVIFKDLYSNKESSFELSCLLNSIANTISLQSDNIMINTDNMIYLVDLNTKNYLPYIDKVENGIVLGFNEVGDNLKIFYACVNKLIYKNGMIEKQKTHKSKYNRKEFDLTMLGNFNLLHFMRYAKLKFSNDNKSVLIVNGNKIVILKIEEGKIKLFKLRNMSNMEDVDKIEFAYDNKKVLILSGKNLFEVDLELVELFQGDALEYSLEEFEIKVDTKS